jgi:ATP-dependent Lon protease
LDKISATPKGEEIQNLLVHLTDPTQNADFEDKYLAGIPLDLSQSLFVFSGNDINKIDRILLDRFTVVHLEGYGLKEKMEIAEKFLLPGALREVNLGERIGIPKEVVTHIMETYAKEEPGVRELKRCMEQIAQKINMLRLFNSPDLPFHIKDFSLPFILKKEHIDKFLKERKPSRDVSHLAMYT